MPSRPEPRPAKKHAEPLQKNPFSGIPLDGFAKFAAEQTGVRLEKPVFKGRSIKAFRLRPTRAQRMLAVTGNLSGLPQFKGWKPEEIARVVGEAERRLYTSVDSREQIAMQMSGDKALAEKLGLEKLAPNGLKISGVLVNAIEEITGARHNLLIHEGYSVVSPRVKKLIFRQFDRLGVGASVKIAKRHGLGGRKHANWMKSLRNEWIEQNKDKPSLYRMDMGRSVQSFVRIMWKLQNYNFFGAKERIASEEALEREPISPRHLRKYFSGNKEYLRLAMETGYWTELEQTKPIPDFNKRVPFTEGFREMLRAEGIGRKSDPKKAKELEARARTVLKGLDWTNKSVGEIAKKTGETENFVKMVNVAFNARPRLDSISNKAGEFIKRAAKLDYGDKTIPRKLGWPENSIDRLLADLRASGKVKSHKGYHIPLGRIMRIIYKIERGIPLSKVARQENQSTTTVRRVRADEALVAEIKSRPMWETAVRLYDKRMDGEGHIIPLKKQIASR